MRTAILNGFGRSLGDSLIGLQALRVALDEGAVAQGPTLFRLAGLRPILADLYAAADFARVDRLADDEATPDRPFAQAGAFDRVIDLRDFAFDPAFAGVSMVDYFLARLGVDPAAIASERKRNTWLASRMPPPANTPYPPYALLCPRASMPLRDMPDDVHAAIVAWLRRETGLAVATQGPALPGTLAVPSAMKLAELCGWVANAAWLIATDTGMAHVADAYSVPTLALFTTHDPAWRVRDYPHCVAVRRPVPGLQPAIEFARDAADLAAARAAWYGRDGLAWLDRALRAAHGGSFGVADVRPG